MTPSANAPGSESFVLPAWTTEVDQAALLELADLATGADGIAPLSGHLLEALGTGHDRYLLPSRSGILSGVVVSHQDDPAELVVSPACRRAGLGTALVEAALQRSGAVWAHGDLPAAQALAGGLGLVRTRELLQMRRALSPEWAASQAVPLPGGVRLRTFVVGQDEEEFLGVNARAFAWHPEQGRLDLDGLRAEMAQEWFSADGFFLAVDDDDRILGFHWTKVHPGNVGEVYVLGVDPEATLNGFPVRGLGAPLTAAGLVHLAGLGSDVVLLYVEGDNVPALKLYRRLGFETFRTDVVYRRPGSTATVAQ